MSIIERIDTEYRAGDIIIHRDKNGKISQASAHTDVGKKYIRNLIDSERIVTGNLYYTLGHPKIYDINLLNDFFLMKLGRENDYLGGYVFLTIKSANKLLAKHNKYKVYGLIINNPEKDIDFTEFDTNGYGYLLKDSYITKSLNPKEEKKIWKQGVTIK